MPGLTDFGEDTVLNDMFNAGSGFAIAGDPFVALHTADPGDTGASAEVAGGSYARQQAAFTNSSAGALENVSNIDFTNMPSTTVVAWSIWDNVSAGNCLQTGWFSTVSGLAVVRSADLTADDVQTFSHGLVTDDRVEFEQIEGLTMPNTLVAGTLYFVLAAGLTTDAFRFASTSGGAAINMTTGGSMIWRKVTPKVVNSGDTFRISAGALDIFATE